MNSSKKVKTSVMLEEESASLLNKICQLDRRSKSHMMDWLILQEAARRFSQPNEHITIEEAEKAVVGVE